MLTSAYFLSVKTFWLHIIGRYIFLYQALEDVIVQNYEFKRLQDRIGIEI